VIEALAQYYGRAAYLRHAVRANSSACAYDILLEFQPAGATRRGGARRAARAL
jgi:hypothetical protein